MSSDAPKPDSDSPAGDAVHPAAPVPNPGATPSPNERAAPLPSGSKPPDETGAALDAYVQRTEKRLNRVRAIFNNNEFSPLTSKAFGKFVRDQYSEAAMRFVLTGVVNEYDAATTEGILSKAGFTVAGSNPNAAPANEKSEGYTAPSTELPNESGKGTVNGDHPLVSQAMGLGFDPNEEIDD